MRPVSSCECWILSSLSADLTSTGKELLWCCEEFYMSKLSQGLAPLFMFYLICFYKGGGSNETENKGEVEGKRRSFTGDRLSCIHANEGDFIASCGENHLSSTFSGSCCWHVSSLCSFSFIKQSADIADESAAEESAARAGYMWDQNNLNIVQSHQCDSETKDHICNHFPHSPWTATFSEVAASQFSIPDKYLWLKRSGRVQTHNDLHTSKVFWHSERSRRRCVHCACPGLQGKIYGGNVSNAALNGCYMLTAKFHIFLKMHQKM